MNNGLLITEIDLNAVKEYLRIDHEDDDVMLNTFLFAAKSFIQSHLKRKFEDFEELPGEFTVACLAIVAHWYEKRQIVGTKDDGKELAFIFSGLLDLHRNWN